MMFRSTIGAVSGLSAGALLLAVMGVFSGCQSVYYGTMEKFGIHKRDMLVERVEEAKDSQEEAKEQFASALEEFLSVTEYEGGDLQAQYEKLADELERSEEKAREVRARIDSIGSVAESLFREWESELEQYTNQTLRESSERQLDSTRARYDRLMVVMRRAEDRMEPVLAAFRDQVLYLKHNLNARALASLEQTSAGLQEDINNLIKEMEGAIEEASAFISAMQESEAN
jgi:chromosome segregation ATPase